MNKPNKETRKHRGREKKEVLMPSPDTLVNMPEGYGELLVELKQRILQERLHIVMTANTAMILLYWDIGQTILQRQSLQGWGARVIDRLSHDLKAVFVEMSGFSARNLKYMRLFASAWPDREAVQRTVAQLAWRTNIALLEKLDSPELRLWYAQRALTLGLSKGATE